MAKRTPTAKTKAAPTRRRKPAAAPAGSSGPLNPIKLAVQQQAWLTGTGPGWWISDHLEELRHFVSWVYVGVHKIAQQWAQANANVYVDGPGDEPYGTAGLTKHLGNRPDVLALARHFRRLRVKSAAPDSPVDVFSAANNRSP